MIADVFIDKTATVANLGRFFENIRGIYEDSEILCFGGVVAVSVRTPYILSEVEIRDTAAEVEWMIKSIERRQ